MSADLQLLKEKLDRLELSNRRIKRGGIVAFVCMAAIVSIGAQQTPNRTMEANEFVVRDTAGQIRARLFSDKSGPHLALYRPSGEIAAFLDADGLGLAGDKGYGQVELSTTRNGGDLLMQTADEKRVVHLETDSDGASLFLQTQNEHFLASVGRTGTGLEIADQHGFETHLGVTEMKTVRTGESRTTSAASLVMFGKDGSVIWSAP
jgi:hypothetical protein